MSVVALEPFELRLKRAITAAGFPLERFEVDQRYELTHEPDETVGLRSWSLGRETWREKTFTAPLFRWQFADGRRFQGRPHVKTRKTSWGMIVCGGECAELDERPMLEELMSMIRRSWTEGEVAPHDL
jgi:hypothetical protein